MGSNGLNPIDSELLLNGDLFLQVALNNTVLEPRQALSSAPYARASEVARHVEGGAVNATEISINGVLVVDSNGSWVGPTIATEWGQISSIPSDLADGDDVLSEAQVEGFVTNSALSLADGSTVAGQSIVTSGGCADGELLVYSLSAQNWACGTDQNDTLTALEVQAMVEAVGGLALSSGVTVGGSPVVDSLAGRLGG